MRKFKGIHAICFLLKSNEARLTQYLQYSFAHLFSNLPKSVTPSIFFVFTNARTSFYKDGLFVTLSKHFCFSRQLEKVQEIAFHFFTVSSKGWKRSTPWRLNRTTRTVSLWTMKLVWLLIDIGILQFLWAGYIAKACQRTMQHSLAIKYVLIKLNL